MEAFILRGLIRCAQIGHLSIITKYGQSVFVAMPFSR